MLFFSAGCQVAAVLSCGEYLSNTVLLAAAAVVGRYSQVEVRQ